MGKPGLFKNPGLCALALLACSMAVPAAEPSQRVSPLDRLQGRSATTRWEGARSQWVGTSQAAANQPAAVPPAAEPEVQNQPGGDAAATPIVADESEAFGRQIPEDVAPAAPTTDPFSARADGTLTEPAPLPQDRRAEIRRVVRPARRNPATEALAGALQAPPPQAPPAQVPPADYGLDPAPSQLDVAETPQEAFKPISAIQPFYDYSPDGDDPCEHLCPLPGMCPDDPNLLCPGGGPMPVAGSTERYFPHLEFYWAASNLHHNPLYFENPILERYGHVHHHDCVEPVFSVARFGVQFVSLPYQIALDPVWRRQYDLGWYRPGDFAPKLIYQPPLNARAAATAAGVYTGLSFLLFP